MHHLMPALPRSRALTRVICKMAPFDVLYGTKPGCATNALVEAMFTIAPAVLAATMALAACLVAKEVPLTFVPNTWSQSARIVAAVMHLKLLTWLLHAAVAGELLQPATCHNI